MKTKRMVLERKDEITYIYACGECFAICEEEDNFCWGCGAEFEGEAYNRDDFKILKVNPQ